jgi:hypothetical protein
MNNSTAATPCVGCARRTSAEASIATGSTDRSDFPRVDDNALGCQDDDASSAATDGTCRDGIGSASSIRRNTGVDLNSTSGENAERTSTDSGWTTQDARSCSISSPKHARVEQNFGVRGTQS